jgi:hypothetical protein
MQARSRSVASLLSLVCSFIGVARAQSAIPHQVAAPPSDILAGVVRLPDPACTPTSSAAIVLPLAFTRDSSGTFAAELDVPVESAGTLALAILSPDAGSLQVSVRSPGSAMTSIARAFALTRTIALVGDDLPGWVLDRYDLRDAPAGRWVVRVASDASRSVHAPSPAFLIVRPSSELAVDAYVSTQSLVGDGDVEVLARMRSGARASEGRVVIESDSGARVLAMRAGGAGGDGVLGARVPAELRGMLRARVELRGVTANGFAFLRTVEIAFPVLERALFLDGTARVRAVDGDHAAIEIGAIPVSSPRRLHVSAEVWAHDESGSIVPVCWLSRMLDPELHAGGWTLPLVLDTRWLELARADSPLELREVRVQDPDTEVVLARAAHIALASDALPPIRRGATRAITPEMLTGVAASTFSSATQAGAHAAEHPELFNPALMLVHGYCSSGSIWPAADFTQPKLEFLDPNQNRTNDQFAQIIIQQAQAASLSSFGAVTHSQGGLAALHLLTYYQSGLDVSHGPRRIQALAGPFQGTPLASLGFFACGTNNDMTPSGAATWLAGIPSWARAEVWFWTTSDGGNACNALTNLFLLHPNDGVVEVMHGQLPGGNAMGNTTGWCHTTGMSYPASYTDHTRNQAMNAVAAR